MKRTLLVLALLWQVTSLAAEGPRSSPPRQTSREEVTALQHALHQLRQRASASVDTDVRAEVDEAAFIRILKLFRSAPELRPPILEGLEKIANDPTCKAVAPGILLRLGDLVLSRDENKALAYYQAAAKHPVKMNPWGYEQQTALQRVAALHEKQGKYREAVNVLASWEIREQCGTGAASRDVERQMKILELRRHYEADAVVFKDLWAAVEGNGFPWAEGSGSEDMASRVRVFYGPERLVDLKSDMAEAQKRLASRTAVAKAPSSANEAMALLLKTIQEQVRYVETVKQAEPKKLADLLDERVRSRAVIDQRTLRVFWEDRRDERPVMNQFWREFLILDAIALQGHKVAQPLIERMERLPSDVYLVALGRAGGKAAIEYLFKRATQAQTSHAAYNCYMGLLLTGDKGALKSVRKAAQQDANTVQAEGARWALQEREQPLQFALDPEPIVRAGSREIPLAGVRSFISQRGRADQRQVLYLPDDVPIDTAIELFREFSYAGAARISVYAENARGDWPKREIGIEVGSSDPVRVVTEFAESYPESLKAYLGNDVKNTLLVAKCALPEVGAVLKPLLHLSARKHVRIQEVGSQDGTPAKRYLQVLEELVKLDVTTVSFYGVYIE